LNISASLKTTTVALLLSVLALEGRQDRIDEIGIRVTGGAAAVRLALPEFRPTTPGERSERLAKVFNDTLRADIDFSGNIELASPSFYPQGTFAAPGDIKVEDWTGPGIKAQYIGYGSLAVTAAGITATGRLRDLGAPQDSFGSLFPGTGDEAAARLVAHNLADRILRELGFGRGIFHTQIAFVSDRSGNKEIYVMDYDGTNQRPITANGGISIAPSWSPVDDRIAYTVWRPGPQIAIASAVGQRHSFTQVTGVTNNIPSWSPDGKFVVYASRRDGNSEIYVADADGRNPRRLTTSPAIDTSPVFNPATGRTIAFTSDRTGTQQIHTMNADGTDIQRITEEGGDAENPAYSPDGRFLAFAWNKPRSGGYDIYIFDTLTRKFTQITSNAGNNENPTWAPDGKHIAFESNRSGTTQIYSMIVSGGRMPLQLTNRGSNGGPTWSGFATP
jgi:TolB protein